VHGTPPCPLWAAILHSLGEIRYTIVLDRVVFQQEAGGYESTFHFEERAEESGREMETARNAIRRHLFPVCSSCSRIRNDEGEWIDFKEYIGQAFHAEFTHGICNECASRLYPGLDLSTGRAR